MIKEGKSSPLVLSIPHASVYIPDEERDSFLLDETALSLFIDEAIDWYTDELYDVTSETGGVSLCHGINRVVVDTERYEDDERESMAAQGLGALYVKTYSGEALRNIPTSEKREELLNRYFRSYHKELEELVSQAVERFGYCLLLDCHSFGSIRAPSPFYDVRDLPDLCIGTDSRHEEPVLTDEICDRARDYGLKVKVNDPYSGVVIPQKWYGDKRVIAYMLELNKSLYLKEGTTEKSENFSEIRLKVKKLVQLMVNQLSTRTY